MYAEQAAQQQAPKQGGDEQGRGKADDDNVVDAEFEEVKNDK
jgi:molecular chaperone DnaK